jgi:glycosyl transferase/beta-hydroxylase protein BlmF
LFVDGSPEPYHQFLFKSQRGILIQRYALVCPTRGRPNQLQKFVESALTKADNPQRVEILLYIDDDDPEFKHYEASIANFEKKFGYNSISITLGPSVGVPRAANILFNKSTADVFLISNDDQVFIDHGWDARLDKEINKFPDSIFCIWFNDKWESRNFCTFPILSRKWIETLGYLQFPFFEHFFTDAWIWMLAKAIGRDHYIDDIVIEHRHWKTGKSEKDATYTKHLTTEGKSRHARDRSVIDRFERYFHADVEALKKVMD